MLFVLPVSLLTDVGDAKSEESNGHYISGNARKKPVWKRRDNWAYEPIMVAPVWHPMFSSPLLPYTKRSLCVAMALGVKRDIHRHTSPCDI
ncbi:hypothetical protein YC2023_012269 [Brassica napus]